MTILKTWSTGFRLLVVTALFFLTGGVGLAYQGDIKDAVEDGDSEAPGLVEEGDYASPQYDVGITWTDAWAVGETSDPNVDHAIGGNYDGPVASDPDLGDIVFLVDSESESSVLSLGFSPNEAPVDPEMLLQSMGQPTFLQDNLFLSEDAEILLLESNRETAAILAREAAPNDDHLVYLSIVADPGRENYSFWVGLDMYEPDEYDAILTSMDDDIDVQDNDVFDVFGPEDILDAIENGPVDPTDEPTEEPVETEEATEEPVETEEATEEPVETDGATEEPGGTLKPIAPLDATEEPAATEEGTEPADLTPAGTPEAPADASPAASPDAPGLVTEGVYVSPQHEVPVIWTEEWTLDDSVAEPVQSFPETGVDALKLTDAATGNATVYITIEDRGDFTPRGALDALSATAYIESVLQLSAETDVVLTGTGIDTVAVVYVHDSGAEPIAIILEANIVDQDTVAFVEVRANATELNADLLDALANDLTIGGEVGLSVFTTDEIIDALP